MNFLYRTIMFLCSSLALFASENNEQTFEGEFSQFICRKAGEQFVLKVKPTTETTLPIVLESFLPGSEQAKFFQAALEKAFSEEQTIRHYATYPKLLADKLQDCQTDEEKAAAVKDFATEKAVANVNVHLGTATTCLPRFSIRLYEQCIGFVRLGNGILSDAIKAVFAEKMQYLNLGKINPQGIGEPAIVLQSSFQNSGIGSLIVNFFFDSIIPAYTSSFLSHIQFSGGPLQAIYFTQSPQNIGSVNLVKKIPAEHKVLEAGEIDGKLHFLILLKKGQTDKVS
jgi:hypothetical protein